MTIGVFKHWNSPRHCLDWAQFAAFDIYRVRLRPDISIRYIGKETNKQSEARCVARQRPWSSPSLAYLANRRFTDMRSVSALAQFMDPLERSHSQFYTRNFAEC